MLNEIDVRTHLIEAIKAKRGIMAVLNPSYQLVISALKWCIGEGKKDNAIPGFGKPRGEDEIRERLFQCRNRQAGSFSIIALNWQVICASLEWVLGDSDITPLEARKQIMDAVLFR